MGGADHRPFAPDLIEPAEQELPEAPGLLDLPEHGLDDLLPEAIAAAAAARFKRAAIALINGIFVSLRRPAASASRGVPAPEPDRP